MSNGRPASHLPRPHGGAGFTLVEMLVSVVILIMIMVVIASVTSMADRAFISAANSVSAFQEARDGFEAITETLSQATLNTYWDYVDANGTPRTNATLGTFVPAAYKRASDLHFLSGSAAGLVPPGGGNQAMITPGDAVFFQATLGRSGTSPYEPLKSSLNAVGFYVQFSSDAAYWPNFISRNYLGTGNYRYRLMEWLGQTQNMHVYDSTLNQSSYKTDWFGINYLPSIINQNNNVSLTPGQDPPVILADDVVLLIILPKLAPGDEENIGGANYDQPPPEGKQGTLLCPNYQYDSRAWMSGYTGNISTAKVGETSFSLVDLMRNQLPPLVDVVMVAVSHKDMLRLQKTSGSNPPAALQVPATNPNNSNKPYFQSSEYLAVDMQGYETQLTNAHITYKVFWTTVQIASAKWSPN